MKLLVKEMTGIEQELWCSSISGEEQLMEVIMKGI